MKDKILEFISAVRTVNRSRVHRVDLPYDEPCYWQTEEWIDWILGLADDLEKDLKKSNNRIDELESAKTTNSETEE